MLKQIYYTSDNYIGADVESAELQALITRAREKNLRKDITGCLIVEKNYFVQFFEGREDNVEELLNIIKKDKRHGNVNVIADRSIRQRSFSSWSMEMFVRAPHNELVFRNHSVDGIFDPRNLQLPAALSLAMNLSTSRILNS